MALKGNKMMVRHHAHTSSHRATANDFMHFEYLLVIDSHKLSKYVLSVYVVYYWTQVSCIPKYSMMS